MNEMKQIFLHIIRGLLGLLFILSGITKVIDTGSFVNTAWQYIPGALVTMAAVVLPAIEIVLGLMMMLCFQVRKAAAAILILTIGFTLIFAYGYWIKGITDCGCFGRTEWLKLPPSAVFLRNALIILAALWLFYQFEESPVETREDKELLRYKVITLLLLSPAAFTVAGVSYKSPYFQKEDIIRSSLGKPIRQTGFKNLKLPADSTYGIFLFSPGCPHCWDASANVASWKAAGLVDGLIAVTGQSQREKTEQRYRPWFGRGFNAIRYIPDKELERKAGTVPQLVIVQRDTVVFIQSGNIPSGYRLKYFNGQETKKKMDKPRTRKVPETAG